MTNVDFIVQDRTKAYMTVSYLLNQGFVIYVAWFDHKAYSEMQGVNLMEVA